MPATYRYRNEVNPRRLLKGLFIIICVLLCLSLFFQSLKYIFHLDFPGMNFLIYLFNVDQENNIPTFFSCILLLLAAQSLASIARHKTAGKQPYYRHWWLLSGLFLVVAIDEFAAMHERLSEIVRDKLHVSGFLYYAWIIPAFFFVLFLVIIYAGFVFRYLPKQTRIEVILAASIFIGGSLCVEMLEGRYFLISGSNENMVNALLTSVEEGMEMIGVAIFYYSMERFKLLADTGIQVNKNQRKITATDNSETLSGIKVIIKSRK